MSYVRRYRVETALGNLIEVSVALEGDKYLVKLSNGDEYLVRVLKFDERLRQVVLEVNGEVIRIEGVGGDLLIDGMLSLVKRVSEAIQLAKPPSSAKEETVEVTEEKNVVRAPLTGRIVDVRVKVGDFIEPETVVATMESMKMLIEVKSGAYGLVSEVYVEPGKVAKKGDILLKLKHGAKTS
ncbi:MAG: biotin/lipoyl-containing protein [Desulfurococcaceae archaeon]